jgi:hypothetical protein
MKKIIASVDGGLVNKMLAFMSLKVIAKLLDRELYIYWTPHLGGLCENLLILLNDHSTTSITAEDYNSYLKDQGNSVFSKEEFELVENHKTLYKIDNIVIKEFWLDINPIFIDKILFKQLMCFVWQNLEIKNNILNRVPAVNGNAITLHIRKHHYNIKINMSTYENIIAEELSNNGNTKIFLTTDNYDDKSYLMNKYPNNCFTNNITSYWDTKNETGVIEALIDILTINQTTKIYTPVGSTFTYLSKYEQKNIPINCINNDY